MIVQPSRRVIHPKDYGAEQDQDEPEGKFIEAEGDLKGLIIYAKATSIKPWCWNKQQATSVTQMFSFGECKAAKLCTNNDKCTRGESKVTLDQPQHNSVCQIFLCCACSPYACLH